MLKKITTIVLLCIAFANSFYLDSKYKATIKVKAANVYANDTNVPMTYKFNLGTPVRADGQDIVITTTSDVLVQRTISSVDDGSYIIYYKDPAQTTTGGGTELLVQWGGSSVNIANNVLLWQDCHGSTDDYVIVVHGEETSANLTDESGNYTLMDTNITYAQAGKIGSSPKGNGASTTTNLGFVSELDAVTTFTIVIWCKTVEIDDFGYFLDLYKDANNRMYLATFTSGGGNLFFAIGNGAGTYLNCDWSSQGAANNTFQQLAAVYDGGLAAADRAKLCLNGSLMVSTPTGGTIPTSMADYTTEPFRIFSDRTAANSFNGEIDEFRLFTGALSVEQIKTQYDNQNLFSTNGSIAVGGVVSSFSNTTQKYKNPIYNNRIYRNDDYNNLIYKQ